MANIKDLIQSIESADSSFDEKLAAINAMEETLVAIRAREQDAIDDNVSLIVEAIRVMERKVEAQLEIAKAIVPEKGEPGIDGKMGSDGLPGRDGKDGQNGQNGKDGQDGENGVSVTDAKIDFDGSLIITLSTGREINVGEVVAPDLAEKIKVTMSTNSTVVVQDEGTTITSGVRSINFTGAGVTATASGDSVTVDVTGGGGGSVTNVTGTAPVVSSGGATPAISLASGYGDTQNPYASKTANFVLAAPNGSAGVPTFRAVVAADIPTLNQNTTGTAANVTGIVAVANGGSGTATPSLVAGTNVTITGSWPNQTIAASGGGGGASALTISNKTAAYTVVAGDLGTIINCTSGTFTVSLTAAATLGAGFNVTIWNTGTGVITIDPNGAETIDGKTTVSLYSGEGTQVVCDGTNWQSGDKKRSRLYAENSNIGGNPFPVASGASSVAIGAGAQAVANSAIALGASYASGATSFSAANGNGTSAYGALGNSSIAIGENSKATTTGGVAIGGLCVANSSYATAIGRNSAAQGAQAFTESGAMALGGSYASGADSFAAGIGTNSSSLGARSTNSIAIGSSANSNGGYSTVLGGHLNIATANWAAALGGRSCTAGFDYSIALGYLGVTNAVGKITFGHAGGSIGVGGLGWGKLNLYVQTTTATPAVLTSSTSAAGSNNQVIVPNSSAYAFSGIIVARRQASGGTEAAAWKVEGLIRREANAASTTLVASTVTNISNVPGWGLALSADTTNGGLAITATGAASTNIRWIATIDTSEVVYA